MAGSIQWDRLETIGPIPGKGNAFLVRDSFTGVLYLRKTLQRYDEGVYKQIAAYPHPNLALVYGLRHKNGWTLALEEYVQGVTLDALLAREGGTLPEAAVARIALGVTAALMHLHSLPKPVVHRDIKPSNIIQEPNGGIRLVDYDISRVHRENMSTDTTVLGTAGYAAPEAYGFAQTDARSDIYSLGVLMHVMLCGGMPQQSFYGGPLKSILQKCMAFNPEERYDSATGLYNDLAAFAGAQAFAQDSPAQCPKTLPDYIPGFRTRKVYKMAAALLVYVLVLGFSLTLGDADTFRPTWALWLFRFATLVLLFSLLAIYSNFLGVQDHLPLLRQPSLWKRTLGGIMYLLAALLVYLGLLALLINL